MEKRERISVTVDSDMHGRTFMTISNIRGAGLTLADINNKLSELYGGGVYAIILQNPSGECTDKISSIEVYDVDDVLKIDC